MFETDVSMSLKGKDRMHRRFVVQIAAIIVVLILLIIGMIKPELFLKVPTLGYVPWIVFTGKLVPYVDLSCYRLGEFGSWIKDSDLIVSGAPKAGTNWMLYLTHQIRTKGIGSLYTDVNMETVWPELMHYPGQTWTDLKEAMNDIILENGENIKDLWDSPDYPFRIFKSHSTPRRRDTDPSTISDFLKNFFFYESVTSVLPVLEHPNVKFLVIIRNGEDVAASFYHFFRNHRNEF